jgi:Carboxypeptidase regulatory-like domain/TonB-dependent Receptor Plug Domain
MAPAMAGRRGTMRTAAAAVAQLMFTASLCAAQTTVPLARLLGTVVDSAGAPLAGAAVAVLPDRVLQATTDDSGRFVIEGVPAGPVRLAVRRLGYAPRTFTVAVRPAGLVPVQLSLSPAAFALQPVTVADSAPDAWMQTFDLRRRTERGYFITRSDIERSQARSTFELLRRIPGVRIANGRWGPVVLFERGGTGGVACTPQLFIHRMAYDGSLEDFPPDDVEAMEIYTGISTVPVELQSARAHTCGAIVIWTRDPDGGGGEQ